MSVTSNLEKMFYAYAMENPKYFDKVSEHYFDNEHVKIVFGAVKKYLSTQKSRTTPSIKKIVELVRLEDRTKERISDEILQAILSADVGEYQDDIDDFWLQDKFKSWLVEKGIRERMVQSITKLRELDDKNITYDSVLEVFHEIKNLVGDTSLISHDDDTLGSDFDDASAHEQNTVANKIPTGWADIQDVTGGIDRKSLTMFLGSSNSGKSLWLANLASNVADNGHNVIYFTLEMSEQKVMKRIGAARLKIPIYEYDNVSKDTNFIQGKLNAMHTSFQPGDSLFEHKVGTINVKEYPAGTATIYDLEEYVKKYEEVKNLKVDMIVVDYIGIMNADAGNNSSLYQNGKKLAEGLRALAQKHNLAAVTASQVSKDAWGAQNAKLSDIADSKAYVETSDLMFGIIRTDEMRTANVYHLQLLKLRDGDFKWTKARFKLDTKYLRIEDDGIVE